MAKKKTSGKTSVAKREDAEDRLVPQPHGGALLPGGTGAGGRPPNEFKRKMAELASSDGALSYLEECLNGEHGPKAAVSAHKHVTERGYGKVPQEVTGKDGEPLEVRFIVSSD